VSEAGNGVIPASHRDLLQAPLLAHMATTGPRGEPQSSPVWFDWDGEHLLIGMGVDRQKYRNLKRDPRLAMSIVDATNQGRYIEVRGRVAAFDPDLEGQGIRRLIRKYTGADELPGIAPERVILVIEPLHTSHMG
jgi:PPOX class probable F420-dependent enzyme